MDLNSRNKDFENLPGDSSERIVPMRLQKFLARAGIASRRGSENLMSAGRVTVNGEVVFELGSRLNPLVDEVAVDGRPVAYPGLSVTLMLNKPIGYITSMSDPHGRPCVSSLVPVDSYPGLYPLGRLDVDTSGLLLFSTDGDLGPALLHPSHHVMKSYEALVTGKPDGRALERLRLGIELDDGMCMPAQVELVSYARPHAVLHISISEGRKRQVRRMLKAVGHPVVSLHRFAFGPLLLGDLEVASWRLLTPEELSLLKG